MKKHDMTFIGSIVILAIALVWALVTGDDALVGRIIETALEETIAPSLEGEDGEVITLTIANDGDMVKHTDNQQLIGGIDFTGVKGDSIVLQKQDGVWVEIGRRLVEMEAYK
jgi:hypothetical protein